MDDRGAYIAKGFLGIEEWSGIRDHRSVTTSHMIFYVQ
jgi:hypothetical protein